MSSGRVINNHNRNKYTITEYEFGSVSGLSDEEEFDNDEFVSLTESLGHKSTSLSEHESAGNATQLHSGDNLEHISDVPVVVPDDKTIQLLYQKIEELTDKVVKYEMALEAKDAERDAAVAEAKGEYYQQGYQACSEEISGNYARELEDKEKMLSGSVLKLDGCIASFDKKLEDIQKELVTTALAIGSEVIKVELSTKSSQVATMLAKELLSKLQDASSVTIKVNSEDLPALNESLSENTKVTLEADDAILKGGVILLSPMGNLDGTIASRLEKVIKEATQA